MRRLAHLLDNFGKRGGRLRFDGEDGAIAAARLERLDWIPRDRGRVARHISRRLRGYARATGGDVCAEIVRAAISGVRGFVVRDAAPSARG